jgi:hypothetical protein
VRSSLRLLAGAALPLLALVGGRTDAGAVSHRAALVIEHSNGSLVERCVTFAAQAISGLQLIQLAQVEYRTQGFGEMGQAVCQLDFEPAQVPSGCFGNGPSWEYYRETASGWSLSGSGASASTVHDGDVDGWHYAAGPQPPPRVAFSQVCTPPMAAAPSQVAPVPAVAASAHQAAALPNSAQAPATEVSDPILYHPPMRAFSILPAKPSSAASSVSPPVDPRAAAVFSATAFLLGMSLLYGWRRRAP